LTANGPRGGAITVQAEGGTLLADGRVEAKGSQTAGGEVKLLGEQVGLVGQASVDASGRTGGGSINVGGSRQGLGPLPNSRAIYVGAEATVDASALDAGDGGTIIAYADDAARIYGSLAARGGPNGGDGGFIETSGKQFLDLTRAPDAGAPAGRSGEWLVDPFNIQIVAAAGTCINLAGCAPGPVWTSNGNNAQLSTSLINTALNAGTAVTITTGAGGAQQGDITFGAGAAITKSGGAATSLTMQAHRNLVVSQPITASGAGTGALDVVLVADQDLNNTGSVQLNANITTLGGSVSATGRGVTQNAASTVNVGAGTITIDANDAAINLAGTLTTTNAGATAVVLRDATTAALSNINAASGTVVLGQAGTDNLSGNITQPGGRTITAATLTVTGGAAVTLGSANQIDTLGPVTRGGAFSLNDTTGGLTLAGPIGSAGAAVTVTTAGGALAVNGNVTTTGNNAVTLTGVGVTQAAASTVNAGAGVITVDGNDGAINLAGTLATTSASATAVVIRDATTAALGNVSAPNGRVVLGQAGANNLSGAVAQNGGTAITAASLSAVGGGAVALANANQIGTLVATTATGGLSLNNGNNNLTVGGNVTATNSPVAISTGTGSYTQNNFDLIAGTGAITVTADTVNLAANTGNNAFQTSGTLTLKPATPNRAMSLAGAAGFDLTAAEITALAGGVAAAGNIVIGDAAGSTGTMTVGAPVSFGAKTVTLNAGSFTDGNAVRPITATSLALNARNAGASIGAAGGNNAIDATVTNLRVTSNNGDAYVRTTGAVNLGAGASALGTGGLNLTANGAITQTGAVTAGGSSTLAAGAANSITLANAANDFGSVAVTSGNAVSLVDANTLALGASSVGTIQARTLAGDLTVNGAIGATGAGNSIVLAAANNFVNNVGAGALAVPGAGRWVVYSTSPASNTFGGLASGNQAIWNATFVANPPATIPAGNRYVFSQQPTVTFTSTDAAKTYGDDATAAIAGNFNPAGFVNAAAFGGVFTQDTLANTFTGAPSVTSAGAPPSAGVGPYPITVGAGTLAATTGYGMAFNPAGTLTVGPRGITVTADNQIKVYGSADPALTFTVGGGGLAGGDTVATAFTGALTRAPGETVLGGPYAITQGTLAASPNYTITLFTNGQLVITPKPITVVANNQTKVYGAGDPALTYVATGLVGADTLSGALVRAPGETVAAGPYAITQGTLTNAANPNYTIAFTNGVLTITPAALAIAADSKARPYGDPNPPLTATFTGLTNGDTPAAITGVTLATPATIASNAGPYAITVGSNPNSNYTITYANGVLTITPAPLAVAADDKTKAAGQPNPPFTATFTGFKLGQTVADLSGTLSFTTPATTASPSGTYPITPGGVASTNYAITFVDGQLVVTAAAVAPGAVSGVTAADNALITATQRSVTPLTDELQPGAPVVGTRADCLVLATPAGPRLLGRCY
jgi:hypothetical protein